LARLWRNGFGRTVNGPLNGEEWHGEKGVGDPCLDRFGVEEWTVQLHRLQNSAA
jgi:hypothetical protein